MASQFCIVLFCISITILRHIQIIYSLSVAFSQINKNIFLLEVGLRAVHDSLSPKNLNFLSLLDSISVNLNHSLGLRQSNRK